MYNLVLIIVIFWIMIMMIFKAICTGFDFCSMLYNAVCDRFTVRNCSLYFCLQVKDPKFVCMAIFFASNFPDTLRA